jgi:hypothetical protein
MNIKLKIKYLCNNLYFCLIIINENNILTIEKLKKRLIFIFPMGKGIAF